MRGFGRVAAIALAAQMGFGAQGQDVAGDFDHYVLALSWSPAWCAAHRARRDAEQCTEERRFIVHGLWPQRADGWPEHCEATHRDPTRRETAAMADIMGSGGLAWRQWRKHGRCAAMDPADYFAATRSAAAAVRIPQALAGLDSDVRASPRIIEQALLEINPQLGPDSVTVLCRDHALYEVRVCLDHDLSPIACIGRNRSDCRLRDMMVPAP